MPERPFDRETMSRALAGDREAQRLLGRIVWQTVRKVLRSFPEADQKDVTQRATIRLLLEDDSFDPQQSGSPEAWIRRVTANLATDHIRHRRRESVKFHHDEHKLDLLLAPDPYDYLVDQSTEERVALLKAAIEELDEDYHLVIVMKYIVKMTQQEIAENLDIPEGTVKSRISRARESIKKYIQTHSIQHQNTTPTHTSGSITKRTQP